VLQDLRMHYSTPTWVNAFLIAHGDRLDVRRLCKKSQQWMVNVFKKHAAHID
jgi:hypothetical protein